MDPNATVHTNLSNRIGDFRISHSAHAPKLQLTQRVLIEALAAKLDRLGTPYAKAAAQDIRKNDALQRALLAVPDNIVLTLTAIKRGAHLAVFQSQLVAGVRQKQSLLHRCALTGDVPLLRLLLPAPALINKPDAEGCAPLALALEEQSWEAFVTLVRSGADVNVKLGELPILHMVLSVGADLLAATLIANGADPDARDPDGRTSLMVSTRHCSVEVLCALIARGASVHARDHSGQTALHHLALCRNAALRKLRPLLSAGASLDAMDAAGDTPLHLAATHDAYVHLMREGANPKLLNHEGLSAVDAWRKRQRSAPPILPFDLRKIP